MSPSICGYDCAKCTVKDTCGGCSTQKGVPFHGGCVVAACCGNESCGHSGKFSENDCELKEQLIAEFNALGIEDMEKVTRLNALIGSYINVEYALPSGQTVKLLNDGKVYLGNQICKKGSDRCYGLAADENHLLVCEYGENGSDAEIILYKKRKHAKN
ncbi:MAG: DUF3795 domain-containing protein [Clostridiales bacterium]|nr:DUF3795 domain-containing protein [Clostridiales bacterium]